MEINKKKFGTNPRVSFVFCKNILTSTLICLTALILAAMNNWKKCDIGLAAYLNYDQIPFSVLHSTALLV